MFSEHRHRLEQREMLEHHADAEACARRAGLEMRTGDPSNMISPLVGREDAVDHLDQGRLARAVLAEQRMDLAGLDGQTDVVVGPHAGKGLADADKLEPQGRFSLHLVTPLASPPSVRSAATQEHPRSPPPNPWS